ncbi:MAG TPA: hypothetical protein VGB52_00915 [Actinomycetota bacterium]
MARRIDFSSLTRTERIALGAGLGLFVNGFVPWWYRVRTIEGIVHYNGGLTDLGIVAVFAGAAAAILVGARASIWPDPAPQRDGTVYALLGAIALANLIAQMLRTQAEWMGLYASIALAALLLAAGIKRRAERRAGWT